MRAGVIVAGGRSTRFGDSDKAVADLAGTPMVRRVADRLGEAVDELVVNCREDQVEAIDTALSDHTLEPTFALDQDPDQGPMAGIATGLWAVDSEYAAEAAWIFRLSTQRSSTPVRPSWRSHVAAFHVRTSGSGLAL